jgi:hypothetical protein
MTPRDPVIVDLNRHLSRQEAAERRHDAHGDRAIASIVEDLMDGKTVAKLTLHDFIDEAISTDDLAGLLMAGSRDDQVAKLDALRNRVQERIRGWCNGRGSDAVDDRVSDLEESSAPCRCRDAEGCTC